MQRHRRNPDCPRPDASPHDLTSPRPRHLPPGLCLHRSPAASDFFDVVDPNAITK